MKITVRYDYKEKIINDGICEDVIKQLRAFDSMKIKDYEILIEDVDESTFQIMNGNLFVGILNDRNELYCRYVVDGVSVDLLEEAIEDFFNGETDLSYISWDHSLDDYIPM